MIFEVPIAYHAYGKVNEQTNCSNVGFVTTVAIEVVSLDGGEAPVLAEWDDEGPKYIDTPQHPYMERDHVRFHGGKYWRPVRGFEIAQGFRNPFGVVDAKDLAAAAASSNLLAIADHQNAKTKRGRAPQDHFERVDRNDFDHVLKKVRCHFDGYRVVEGIVYRECGQPVIEVGNERFKIPKESEAFEKHTMEHRHGRTWSNRIVRILTFDKVGPKTPLGTLFPIGDFDSALKKARVANGSNPIEKDSANEFNANRRPRLGPGYLADAATHRETDECALHLRYFVKLVSENRGKLLPVGDYERMRLFCDLSEAADIFPDPSAYELLEETGRTYIERYWEYAAHVHPELEALKRAVDLAEARPVFLGQLSATPRALKG